MIRVAWPIPDADRWHGGTNYFANLAKALLSLPERRIEPIALCRTVPDPKLPPELAALGQLELPRRKGGRLRGLFLKAKDALGIPRPDPLARMLAKHDIRLFSHGWPLTPDYAVPSLCWIPDFQHKYLPEFFSAEEREGRDARFTHFARNAAGVLLSSECAKRDFLRFCPQASAKIFVLPFVSWLEPALLSEPPERVLAAHKLEEPFFYVPNQIWAHKNHALVIEALALLKKQGSCPLVISTGSTLDYRNPAFFAALSQKLADAGLEERFRFLGKVSYAEVCALMRASAAIINPSLFEGWSTTVEEAKSLGKRILLSSIAVHREQAPEHGLFFAPDDPQGLARLMTETLSELEPRQEARNAELAAARLPDRVRAFALHYEDIALACAGCD